MGEIIASKILPNNNILYKVILKQPEVLHLRNAIQNINLFSAELCNYQAKIIKRGNNGVTKYFEVPFLLRSRKKKFKNEIFYQKLETSSKIFYLYVLKKELL